MIRIIPALLCLFSLAGCDEALLSADAVPKGDPTAHRNFELRGTKYHADTMAAANGAFHWAQEALAGYRAVKPSDLPGSIDFLPAPSCTIPRPAATDRVQAIHIVTGRQESAVWQFNRTDIAKRAERYVKAYMRKGEEPSRFSKFSGNDAMTVTNIVVTETSQPTYLVLVSLSNVIWNIHAAPGATLSRIVVIGNDAAGLANVPQGTPVSVIAGPGQTKKCKITPLRQPRESWSFVRNQGGLKSGDRHVAENVQWGARFARWLNSRFGSGVARRVIDPYGVSTVLVGPIPASPEARIAYRPLAGAALLMSRQDYVFAAPRREYEKRNRALVVEAATKAAGGDLAALTGGH